MKIPEALFHYTVGPKLALISASQSLAPAGYGLATSRAERPVLWLSSHPQWERTATKVISTDGGMTYVRPLLGDLQDAVGLYRFRVDMQDSGGLSDAGIKLFSWPQIKVVARIAAMDVEQMTMSAMRLGARPMDWWGTTAPIPLSLMAHGDSGPSGVMSLEVWRTPVNGDGSNWEQVELAAAVAEFAARGVPVRQVKASRTPRTMGL